MNKDECIGAYQTGDFSLLQATCTHNWSWRKVFWVMLVWQIPLILPVEHFFHQPCEKPCRVASPYVEAGNSQFHGLPALLANWRAERIPPPNSDDHTAMTSHGSDINMSATSHRDTLVWCQNSMVWGKFTTVFALKPECPLQPCWCHFCVISLCWQCFWALPPPRKLAPTLYWQKVSTRQP